MKHRIITLLFLSIILPATMLAQEHLQKQAIGSAAKKTFTTVKANPISRVKNQYRSGTCWAYATLGYLESELLRQTGKEYDLCEMFVVSKDYMDCATHYVRMHGYSQISEGGSADDVLDVISRHGICPEEAMAAPGSLTGDSLANFSEFFPRLERTVANIVRKGAKEPMPHWRDSVNSVIEQYLGPCPKTFQYEGQTYTPQSFAKMLGLQADNYVSLTSFTHHPFYEWFVIEAPYKWRLKPSYNLPIDTLMTLLDQALDAGYTVCWGGDVSGNFTRTGLAMLPDGLQPSQELRQAQWDNWQFTYDHVMLIYGRATDEQGKPYYMVKNSWGRTGMYGGTWYMSRDYIALNTTYIFLNRQAIPNLKM